MKNQTVSKVLHRVALKTNPAGGNTASRAAWNVGSEPWPEPVPGQELLDEVAQVFARFVALPKWGAEILALWTIHTYAFDLRDVTTYLGIESRTKRCGQARLTTVLGALVNRPVMASQIRSVPLLRLISENLLTLVLDNEEAFCGHNEDLRQILNSGHTRPTAFVVKVRNPSNGLLKARSPACTPPAPGNAPPIFDPGLRLFSSWCPKAVAAIGPLPASFAERCVIVRLRRKRSHERCERLRNLGHFTSLLRRKSIRFVFDHAKEIAAARPKVPPGMSARAMKIWAPLLVIAEVAGQPWPQVAQAAALALGPG